MEEWRTIPGFEGLYEVSNMGRIRSVNRQQRFANGVLHHKKGYILSPGVNPAGYLQVVLYINHKKFYVSIHRVVATVFIPNPNNLREVNHKNGDKSNNCVDNLEWCTPKQNFRHAWETGLHKMGRRIRCIETGEIFEAFRFWKLKFKRANTSFQYAVKHGTKCAGYHFEYID